MFLCGNIKAKLISVQQLFEFLRKNATQLATTDAALPAPLVFGISAAPTGTGSASSP
jgi:hypothetical protein